MSVVMKHLNEPVPRLPEELRLCQPLIERMLAKERDRRVGSEAEWRELIKPLLKPFKLPRVAREHSPSLPSAKEREKTRLSIDGGKSDSEKAAPAARGRGPNAIPGACFLLNLLLVLAVVLWAFFNYERIPGLLLSLWRAVVGWISSLIATI